MHLETYSWSDNHDFEQSNQAVYSANQKRFPNGPCHSFVERQILNHRVRTDLDRLQGEPV